MSGLAGNSNSVETLWLSLLPVRIKFDLVKHEGARKATCLYMLIFQMFKGRILLQSMVGSGCNLNSFNHFCMSLLSVRIKKFNQNIYLQL